MIYVLDNNIKTSTTYYCDQHLYTTIRYCEKMIWALMKSKLGDQLKNPLHIEIDESVLKDNPQAEWFKKSIYGFKTLIEYFFFSLETLNDRFDRNYKNAWRSYYSNEAWDRYHSIWHKKNYERTEETYYSSLDSFPVYKRNMAEDMPLDGLIPKCFIKDYIVDSMRLYYIMEVSKYGIWRGVTLPMWYIEGIKLLK